MATRKKPAVQRIKIIPKLPPRRREGHKGDYGKVLILSGSVGMLGAPALVGLSALRSGAGLVTIATPRSIQPTVIGICPCATSIPLPETETGQIDPVRTREVLADRGLLDAGAAPDVLVTGPGLGQGSSEYARSLWELIHAFGQAGVPAVVDADALNLTHRAAAGGSDTATWDAHPHFRTVITPHPGELARMHGVSIRDIQADREGFAIRTALAMTGGRSEPEYHATVVLKGAGTVVTDGQRMYVNKTGNPGMATGGSGDVLSGLIGALIGQGLQCFEAAVLSVYLHGLAGDLAARQLGQISMIATDIVAHLPSAFLKQRR